MTSNRPVSEIELCPWCQGLADIEEDNRPTYDGAWVVCVKCGARGPTDYEGDIEKAIAAWNTRASSQALSDDVVERAKQILKDAAQKHRRYWGEEYAMALDAVLAVIPSAGGVEEIVERLTDEALAAIGEGAEGAALSECSWPEIGKAAMDAFLATLNTSASPESTRK
jgi:hypothetical protein